MKKKDIYKLKRCLRDFTTKDHLCLFLDLCHLNAFRKLSIVPPNDRPGLFLFAFVFFIWFWALSYSFFFYAQNFWSFGFFFMPPRFVRAPLMIENFLLCPLVLLRHFQSLSFFLFLCLLHLPPVWGVILANVIFKKSIRLKRGLQMIYFSLVKRLSKMTFLHFKLMHLGSVSLAFMRVYNVISHYSFK
jgi:hypothetical protein